MACLLQANELACMPAWSPKFRPWRRAPVTGLVSVSVLASASVRLLLGHRHQPQRRAFRGDCSKVAQPCNLHCTFKLAVVRCISSFASSATVHAGISSSARELPLSLLLILPEGDASMIYSLDLARLCVGTAPPTRSIQRAPAKQHHHTAAPSFSSHIAQPVGPVRGVKQTNRAACRFDTAPLHRRAALAPTGEHKLFKSIRSCGVSFCRRSCRSLCPVGTEPTSPRCCLKTAATAIAVNYRNQRYCISPSSLGSSAPAALRPPQSSPATAGVNVR